MAEERRTPAQSASRASSGDNTRDPRWYAFRMLSDREQMIALATAHLQDGARVLQFLTVFARFEFALKFSGFLEDGADGKEAEPNWQLFSEDAALKAAFGVEALPPEVIEAVRTLTESPPLKQVIQGGRLNWKETPAQGDAHGPLNLLLLVRRVRNNLFHGGKFPMKPLDHPERNSQLIEASLVVLGHCWAKGPERVKSAFASELPPSVCRD